MAKTIHDLPETKGTFVCSGMVTGTEKDNFYKEIETKSHVPMRMINFGVKTDKDSTMYVGFNGMVQKEVYYSKQGKKDPKTGKREKSTTKKVKWEDRFDFDEDGYRMIGVNVGVKKKIDEKGKEVNDKQVLHQYDACEEIAENLKDNQSVFCRGNITYSTYNDEHQTRFEPQQISLCRDVDFDAEDFKPNAKFTQTIIFMGMEKNCAYPDYALVKAKIVTYNSIEDTELYIDKTKSKGLCNTFRKALKPYYSIEVSGHIASITPVENVEDNSEDDGLDWGEENEMKKVNSPFKRLLVITGANGGSVEKEVYSEQKVEEAIQKIKDSKTAEKDFKSDKDNKKEDWGNMEDTSDDDDEEVW